MSNSQEIRTGRHCVFNMHVHLVFVAKYQRDVFTKAMLETQIIDIIPNKVYLQR